MFGVFLLDCGETCHRRAVKTICEIDFRILAVDEIGGLQNKPHGTSARGGSVPLE
jgi:hypothetical protein